MKTYGYNKEDIKASGKKKIYALTIENAQQN